MASRRPFANDEDDVAGVPLCVDVSMRVKARDSPGLEWLYELTMWVGRDVDPIRPEPVWHLRTALPCARAPVAQWIEQRFV